MVRCSGFRLNGFRFGGFYTSGVRFGRSICLLFHGDVGFPFRSGVFEVHCQACFLVGSGSVGPGSLRTFLFSSSCPVPEDQDQEVGNLLGRKTETRLNRGCWMSSLHNMWPVMFYGRCIKLKMAALQDSCIEINSSGKSICNRNFLKRCCMPHQYLADVDDCPDLPMLFCLHSVHYFVNSGRLIFPE